MRTEPRPPAWKVLLAFAIIYLVWGSTYLAIRIAVHEVPPFLLASMRFLLAGIILCGWTMARGATWPTFRQWTSSFLLAILIFVFDYGLVFWAELRVPSGVTAVILATVPAFMAVSEIIFLGTQKLTLRLAVALLIGLGGVAVLVTHSLDLAGAPVDRKGALALLIASMSWAISSALTLKLPLPESKLMSSAAQMLAGGLLLALTALARGELSAFHPASVSRAAWLSLAYLIVAGSLLAFTAYIWLIHHESPTKVSTYAYVNPVIAVLLGYLVAGEALGPRTILGTLLVLVSVVVITTTRRSGKEIAASAVQETA